MGRRCGEGVSRIGGDWKYMYDLRVFLFIAASVRLGSFAAILFSGATFPSPLDASSPFMTPLLDLLSTTVSLYRYVRGWLGSFLPPRVFTLTLTINGGVQLL